MNNNGYVYNNQNIKVNKQFIYTHLKLFCEAYDNKNPDIIPIDIELCQYIKDNYLFKQIPTKCLNNISKILKKYKSKLIFYIYVNEILIIFCHPLNKKKLSNIHYSNIFKKLNNLHNLIICDEL